MRQFPRPLARHPWKRRPVLSAELGSPSPRVVVYHAPGCHLCEQAIALVLRLRHDLGYSVDLVDISGDAQLEASHRIYLPVIEIEGERAFVFEASEDALRDALACHRSPLQGTDT